MKSKFIYRITEKKQNETKNIHETITCYSSKHTLNYYILKLTINIYTEKMFNRKKLYLLFTFISCTYRRQDMAAFLDMLHVAERFHHLEVLGQE